MGAVVRSTALLPAIRRKYQNAQITWVTEAPADRLLVGHPQIDHILRADGSELLSLSGRVFDVALVIDKSNKAAGILSMTSAREVYGFISDPQFGKILPATQAALPLWKLGLSDHDKFFVNSKTECELVHTALELGPYQREKYTLHFTSDEQAMIQDRRRAWSQNSSQPVIGINTGCGPLMPAKKWTPEFNRRVIDLLRGSGFENIVLLGGPEDTERNRIIARGLPVISSPVDQGIRDGAMSVAACDIVITGDSFGMHLAIAYEKFVVAWFGPSCAQEIDLFDWGVKVHAAVECSPCWKRSCEKQVMCYDRVDEKQILKAVRAGAQQSAARRTPEATMSVSSSSSAQAVATSWSATERNSTSTEQVELS